MADTSYPAVYLEQGAERLVVGPAGELLLEGAVRGVIKGQCFYVDSATGSNSNNGTSWTRAVATIDYAIGLCTANRGDVIYVAPGHTETISAAAGIVFDIAGVSCIGIGRGTKQPKVTFDTIITADLDIDAANILIQNIHFTANFADITAPIDVNAQFCTIRGCRFSETAVNMNAIIWILGGSTTTSSGLVVEGCYCVDRDAANTHFVSLPGTDDGNIIRNNILHGDWGTAAIGAAGVVTNITVSDNYISNAATDADSGINLAATATGMVMNNRIGIALAGNATTGVTAQACAQCENYVVDTGDRQGVLDPVAT